MKKVVIVGGVAGGMSAAARLRRLDNDAEIIVIEKSGHVSYANCGLPYFVGGVIANEESLYLQTPASLFKRFRLDVRVNSEVTNIDRANQTIDVVDYENGKSYALSYDKLILSPGAAPIRPEIPGIERALSLRTVEDVKKLAAAAANTNQKAVIIGAGFIGLEMAENFRHKGIETTVVEAAPQVLTPVDSEMASFVGKELARNGVGLELNRTVTEIKAASVVLSDGRELPADLVMIAIGVKPDAQLAKMAELTIGQRGGIAVDEFNLTSDRNIYAVGDVAEKADALDGGATLIPLANIANRHGRVVADHIAGRTVRHVDSQGTAIVKVFDLTIAMSGWNERRLTAAGRDFVAIHSHPASHAGYYPGAQGMSLKLLVDRQSQQILGIQGVGKDGVDKRIDVIATAMRGGITAPELADLELAYAPPFGSAKDPVNMLGYIAENVLTQTSPNAQWHQIDSLVNQGYELIDVRTAGEFERGTVTGARNLPVDEIRDRQSELTSKKYLVTCQVGQRGHVATRLLRELGYEAINLDGGYMTWSNSPAALSN